MSRFRTNKQKSEERKEMVKSFTMISQLGVLMVTTVFIAVLIGIWLDKWMNTKFIFTLIFSFLGILAAFRNMYYYTMK